MPHWETRKPVPSVCTVVSTSADWLSVPSVYTVDKQTGGTHSGAMGHCQLYIQTALATSRGGGGGQAGHTGVLSTVHTGVTNNQSDREHTVGYCQLYIQRAQTTSQSGAQWATLGQSAVHTEGTDNESNRGPLGHCLLYIQRAQATRPTGVTHSGAHWGTVNCTYRGHSQPVSEETPYQKPSLTVRRHPHRFNVRRHPHNVRSHHTVPVNIHRALATRWGRGAGYRWHRQPDRQGAHIVGHTGELSTVHAEGSDNQSDCQLCTYRRALATSRLGHRGHRKPGGTHTVHTEGTDTTQTGDTE